MVDEEESPDDLKKTREDKERDGIILRAETAADQHGLSFFPLVPLTVLSFSAPLQHGSISTARTPASSCLRKVNL